MPSGRTYVDPRRAAFLLLPEVDPTMWTLRIVTRVQPQKRQEFAQAVHEFFGPELARGFRAQVFQDLDDRCRFCCMADWADLQELTRFLQSPTFGALKGAAEVLGGIEEIVVLEERETEPEGRDWPRLR